MSTDLYERCTECPGYPTGHCEKCGNRAFIPAGYTAEHVADMRDHLAEGAAMMTALRAEVTQLKAWLKEALERLARGNADTRALLESSERLKLRLDEAKGLLVESKDRIADLMIRLAATGHVVGRLGKRAGLDEDGLDAMLAEANAEVRAEFQAEADAGRTT